MCVEGLVRPALHGPAVMGVFILWVPEVTLRLPVIPFGGVFPRCRTDRSFRIGPRSCEQTSPVIRH